MNKEDYKGIWVFAEQRNGKLSNATLEVLAKSQELKAHNGEEITAVLLGSGVEALADQLFEYGADQVILAEHKNLAEYSARPYQKVLAELSLKYNPSIILYAATSLGRDLAPRMMISLNTGLTADAIDLGYDEDGVFYQTTPAYGGSILAHIVILEKRPQMATVRPKMFDPLEPKHGFKGKLIREEVSVDADDGYEVLEVGAKPADGKSLDEAEIVVAGGRGIQSAEDLAMLNELAELISGQVAGSRPLIDDGWADHSRQIGQSGVTIKPRMIINTAISGSVQYQVGMQKAQCIISINRLADAPIFDISHFGAVADYRKVLPALIEEIKARKNT